MSNTAYKINSIEKLQEHYGNPKGHLSQKELPKLNIHSNHFISISPFMVLSTSAVNDGPADGYERSVLHVSTSNLKTEGGKIDFLEVYYNESRENPQDFKLLTTYPISSS